MLFEIILWIVLFIVVVGTAILGVLKYQSVMGQAREELSEAEARFEEEAVLGMEAREDSGKAAMPESPEAPLAEATPKEKGVPPPPSPFIQPGASAPGTVEELAQRLIQLRVVEQKEGRIQMSVPPDGLIYRLRQGGSCALLPRMESDAFMVHQCKRFDLVFTLTSTGEVLVLERMAGRLPALLDNPSEAGR